MLLADSGITTVRSGFELLEVVQEALDVYEDALQGAELLWDTTDVP